MDTGLVLDNYYNRQDQYSKLNALISSKYKASLLSNRIMAICLSRIDSAIEDKEGGLTVKIKGSEIQKMLGVKGNNFFPQLDKAAQTMTGRSIGWSDPQKGEFEYTVVVTRASYLDNEFCIEFNKHMKQYLQNIKQNFTVYSLKIMLSWKSVYSFRLFELLKSKAYPPKGEKTNKFRIEFDLNELKLDLGVVNAELASVQSVLKDTKRAPDYERAVKASPEKIYTTWYELRRYCIDVAVNEINNLPECGMHVDYDVVKSGKGGKVHRIIFFVETNYNHKEDDTEVVKEEDKDDILEKIMNLIPDIKLRDARIIAEKAEYNYNIIEEKYELATQDINDIVAWMITAIEKDFKKPTSKKRKNRKSDFNNFKEREYDYEELTKIANE